MKPCIQLVTDIMGTKIKTPKGEDVGVVQNIMIDHQTGTIVYIVLCYANFIGKVHRHYAIPNRMLTLKRIDEKSIYLEIDEKKLLNAPRFSYQDCSLNPFQENPQRLYELLPDTPRKTRAYAWG